MVKISPNGNKIKVFVTDGDYNSVDPSYSDIEEAFDAFKKRIKNDNKS